MATLGDVGRYLNGRAFKKAEWSKVGRPIVRIQDLTGSGNAHNYFDGEVAEENLVRDGDLLISWAATIDAFIWRGPEACVNQHIFKVESFIDRKFHFYAAHAFANDLRRRTHGGGIVHVTRDRFDSTPLLLPPLGEQARIVEKLEELLSDLHAGVAALERARANLKRYRAAVLKAAVEGRLTEKWRAAHPDVEPASKLLDRILAERRRKWEGAQLRKYAEKGQPPPKGWKDKYPEPVKAEMERLPELPAGWCWASLDQLAEIGTGATPLRSEQSYWRGGSIAWVTSAAVNEPYVRKASELVTPAALAETNLAVYPKHTLILAMYGEGRTRGKVSELLIEATTNQALAALVLEGVGADCRPYIKAYLAKSYEDMRRIAAGGVQPNLNLGLIREMCVPMPPLLEQAEIVGMIDRLLSVQEQLVEEGQKSVRRGARLRQAILKRAFEGKLVPQDPNDEPASELLGRMRAERDKRAGASLRRSPRRAAV